MHFGGDLSVVEPSTIFQIFNLSSLSGLLKIVSPHECADFYFQDGKLNFASDSKKKRIGEYLVDRGLISREQLDSALKAFRHQKGIARVGQIMIEREYLEASTLVDAIQEQMKESVYKVVNWRKGYFVFFKDLCPSKEEVLLDVRLDHVILEGMRRSDEKKLDAPCGTKVS